MTKAFTFIVVLLWALPAMAQSVDLTDDDRQQIHDVIADQLAAFQRDDAAAAFAHASPTVKQKFRAPAVFMEMVKRGYAPVYRPRKVEFRDLVDAEGIPVQRVYLVGPDGIPVIALYPMERQADGSWRIGGCYLVRGSGDMV